MDQRSVARQVGTIQFLVRDPKRRQLMSAQNSLNRRGFVGGVVTALGYLTVKSPAELWAQARGNGGAAASTADDRGLRPPRQDREQREPVRAARVGDEGDDRRLQVRQSLRLSRRRHRRRDRQAPWREAREHHARRRIRRDSRRRRIDLREQRQEGRRRRAVVQPGVLARHERQGRRDHDSAHGGLSAGHVRPDQDRRRSTTAKSASYISAIRTIPRGASSRSRRSSSCSTVCRKTCRC